MRKTLSNKYGQKRLDSAKKPKAYAIKATSKRAIQKTAEATGDLIGKKNADKATSFSKNSSKMTKWKNRKRYISQQRDNKLLMN